MICQGHLVYSACNTDYLVTPDTQTIELDLHSFTQRCGQHLPSNTPLRSLYVSDSHISLSQSTDIATGLKTLVI